ncbi:MAG: amidohydrolase family protein, partial [Victivallales bacterium]|nr:amidohydrolase family protein [Victivallales bacterium]
MPPDARQGDSTLLGQRQSGPTRLRRFGTLPARFPFRRRQDAAAFRRLHGGFADVDPIMEIARHYRKPVFIHCGHPPFSLPWQIGLLAERHRDVPIVMVHMGHGHGVYIDASITMAKKFDNLFLEVSGMPMGCQIKNAYETVGSERVMFGIDSPFH